MLAARVGKGCADVHSKVELTQQRDLLYGSVIDPASADLVSADLRHAVANETAALHQCASMLEAVHIALESRLGRGKVPSPP